MSSTNNQLEVETEPMVKPKLFVLDDDEQYAELLVDVASNVGWDASYEKHPATFIDSDLPQNGVVILDLNMPEMDGIEVIRLLAKKNSNLIIILISGFDSRVLHSAQQLAEAHNFMVFASLTKPISITEFIKHITQARESIHQEKKTSKRSNPVLVNELENAIEQHQFVLHYQPQVNMQTGDLESVESLIRWQHPELGLLYPDSFISLAEKNNLIDKLTDEVINMAVEQQQTWQAAGFVIPMSINVTAENITSLYLPEKLKKIVDKHTVSPENITIELTESAVMNELTSSLDVLNRLRMKGFSLSIDDFGTGHSSLSHLYQAPFTELKIDRKFVAKLTTDNEALVIVKICIMLGKMLGMKLVVEGVEDEETWEAVKTLGCDSAQGYFIAKPMPADEITQWIIKREF